MSRRAETRETVEDRAIRSALARGMTLRVLPEPDRCTVHCRTCGWGRDHGPSVTSRYAAEPYGCHPCGEKAREAQYAPR